MNAVVRQRNEPIEARNGCTAAMNMCIAGRNSFMPVRSSFIASTRASNRTKNEFMRAGYTFILAESGLDTAWTEAKRPRCTLIDAKDRPQKRADSL